MVTNTNWLSLSAEQANNMINIKHPRNEFSKQKYTNFYFTNNQKLLYKYWFYLNLDTNILLIYTIIIYTCTVASCLGRDASLVSVP